VLRHGFEQMSIGTDSPPQQVQLGAPCPVTNVKFLILYTLLGVNILSTYIYASRERESVHIYIILCKFVMPTLFPH
jgi:hypothetical protein